MINIKNPLFISLYLLASSLLFNNNSVFADTKLDETKGCLTNLCKPKKEKKDCKDRNCCDSCHSIKRKDFKQNGKLSKTFVIDKPGKYCLCESVDFEPVDQDAVAIQILANDVTLNLCGNTLSQSNDTLEVFAIQIGEGFSYSDPDHVLKNINITNGNITNFTGSGIFCYNASFDEPTAQAAFESLTFTDLNILDCGSQPSFVVAGIYLESFADINLYDPSTRVAYKNIIIENCNVNRCLGNGSIYINTADDLVIKSVQANDLSTEVSLLGGPSAYIIHSRNLVMINCQGNGTKDLDPAAFSSNIGSFIEFCVNLTIQNCQFNDIYGESDPIVASAFFNNVQNAIFENCQFNNARGGELVNQVNGVHMSDLPFQETQGNGIKFINCQFNGITRSATGTPVPGFNNICAGTRLITLRNVVFENCQASNNGTEHPSFDCFGFFVGTVPEDPVSGFANTRNVTFFNCVISDIQSSKKQGVGIYFDVENINRTGVQSSLYNTVVENCVIERIRSGSTVDLIAGIAEGIRDRNLAQPFPAEFNLYVKNCRISDVRSLGAEISPLSAGIVAQSVDRPVITENSLSDCDRGILLTGTNEIIPNGFQVAASLEDALAFPPVFIPLDVQLKLFVEPALPGSPFDAFYTINGPRLTAPISAQGEVVQPNPPGDACSTVTNNLTGKIGIVIRSGACGSGTFVLNTEAAGSPIAATLIIDNTGNPSNFGGSPAQTQVAVAISQADGNALLAALAVNPMLALTIDTLPSVDAVQTFSNLARGNFVVVTPSEIDVVHDFILPTEDLTALGWQSGDPIFYDCNGFDAIPDLTCSTTYFAIVYRPGFSENGVIQNNEVDNCSISGYQDDRVLLDGTPLTSSLWVNNTAFDNGTPNSAAANYAIAWGLPPLLVPVDAGSLSTMYPNPGNKYYNLSMIP